MKKELNNFFKKNKNFYKKNNFSGGLLIISVTNNFIFNTILLKFAKAIAEIESLNTVYVPFFKPNSNINKLSDSFNLDFYLNHIKQILENFFYFIPKIFIELFKIKDGITLESYSIKNIYIGKHIYDYILIRNKIPTIKKLSIINRLEIALCLYYFYLIDNLIIKHNIKSLVTLDNVYVEGIVFELARFYDLKMYTGFDINLLTLHLYETQKDYEYHCRTPDEKYISKIFRSKIYNQEALDFAKNRFSGKQNQHDAKRAFSNSKEILSKQRIITDYNLDINSEIVLVLPHVFCDAPHAYPSVFYQDYEHWLIDTLNILNKNNDLNILIKEHPSAELYKEKGYLKTLLENHNLSNVKLVSNQLNSKSLLNSVDYMITCGGTSGMEYAFHGIPVIIASSPPYGNFSFVNKANNLEDYHKMLRNIEKMVKPSKDEQLLASKLLYLFFDDYGIDRKKAHLDCYTINLGENNDLKYFFSHISESNRIKESHYYIKQSLLNMINKNLKNLYKTN